MFFEVRKNYLGNILSRTVGDMRLVVVAEPEELIPGNLYGLKMRDVELEIPEDDAGRDKMFEKACWNTRASMPPRIFSSERISGKDMYRTGVFMEDELVYGKSMPVVDKKIATGGIRLTTSCWFGGAVALFYPGVAERLCRVLGSDYFITFPSVHEVRLHSALWTNAYDVHAAITDWNRIRYRDSLGETLSGDVYRYCSKRGEIQRVEYYDWNTSSGYGII